jgi:hypothetical protein
MSLRIAIDINDVMRDYTRQFAKMYEKFIDPYFEVEYDDIDDINLYNVFPFKDSNGNVDVDDYYRFKYEDYAYELFCRADVMERGLPNELNIWLQNTLRSFGEEVEPSVMWVSPFETNLSIPSTLGFLSRISTRVREYYFPIDSQTVWDKCDVLITANPIYMENVPEGKTLIKIKAPYNKNYEVALTYDSLGDLIKDEENIIIKTLKDIEEND